MTGPGGGKEQAAEGAALLALGWFLLLSKEHSRQGPVHLRVILDFSGGEMLTATVGSTGKGKFRDIMPNL